MKLRKKILSALLGATMVVSATPFTVFGATTQTNQTNFLPKDYLDYDNNICAPEYTYPRNSIHFCIDDNIPLSGLITPEHTLMFLDRMDAIYELYEELTGYQTCNGRKITFHGSDDTYGGAWVYGNSSPDIYINNNNRDQWIADIEDGFTTGRENWCFGFLHELGHLFDENIWTYNAEITANFKMAYILEELNGYIVMNGDYSHQYVGAGIKDYYETAYINSGNLENSFSGDGFTYALLDIKEKIGWQAYAKTFRELLELYPKVLNSSVTMSEGFKINLFLTALAKNSNYDVISYFNEKQLEKIGEEYGVKIEYQEIVGDYNKDGFININDATILQQQLAQPIISVDSDGNVAYYYPNVDINEVTKLQLYIAKAFDDVGNVGNVIFSNPQKYKNNDTIEITFRDETPQSWVKNDGAYLTLSDGNSQEEYVMTTNDNINWTVTIPKTVTSIIFQRRNPKDGYVWNYWTANRAEDDTYYDVFVATASYNGYWTAN